MAKKKTMIYLTERQQWQLKLHAREQGESMAGVIRTAVDEFLARERPPVDYMAIVGIGATEPDDISERVDEFMEEIAAVEDVHGESLKMINKTQGKRSDQPRLNPRRNKKRAG